MAHFGAVGSNSICSCKRARLQSTWGQEADPFFRHERQQHPFFSLLDHFRSCPGHVKLIGTCEHPDRPCMRMSPTDPTSKSSNCRCRVDPGIRWCQPLVANMSGHSAKIKLVVDEQSQCLPWLPALRSPCLWSPQLLSTPGIRRGKEATR